MELVLLSFWYLQVRCIQFVWLNLLGDSDCFGLTMAVHRFKFVGTVAQDGFSR
jgi:hypothetical protein